MIQKISDELKAAMIAKDQNRVMVLRMLKTDIKKREVELMRSLEDGEILELIQKTIKSLSASVEMYLDGGRQDLADNELAGIEVLKSFLPVPLCEEELAAAIQATITALDASGMKDMGKVITAMKEAYGLRVDGKALSIAVKAALSN